MCTIVLYTMLHEQPTWCWAHKESQTLKYNNAMLFLRTTEYIQEKLKASTDFTWLKTNFVFIVLLCTDFQTELDI